MKVNASLVVMAASLALALGACSRDEPMPPKAVDISKLPAEPPPQQATTAPENPAEAHLASADKALAGKVKSALVAERGLNGHEIDVVAKNGVITLYGTASTPGRRDTAARVAGNVEGVKSVENKLAIVAGS